jgi:hypothetical protein
MAQRVFGPVRAAGVQITEKDGDKPIEPGALGWVAYAGVTEKGDKGALIQCTSWEQFKRKCGSYIEGSTLPDCVKHYFDLAAGAGGVFIARVTDGTEVKSKLNLYARRVVPTQIGYLEAKNGGRWAGKRKWNSGDVANAGAIAETALTTAITMLKDQYKGGYLVLDAVPNTRFKITGNTAAGIISIASDQKMKTAWTAAAQATNFKWYIDLGDNEGKYLSAEFRDGEESPDTEFGLYVYVDGELTYKWANLSMDPASSRYWQNVVNDDGSNFDVKVVDQWTGAITADLRPANYYQETATVTALVLTAKISSLVVTTSPTGANPTHALGTTNDNHKPQKLTITMTSPTAFTVVSDILGGSIGAAGTLGVLYTPTNSWVPPFTITNGATVLANGDVLTLVFKPFPKNELIGGYLYPDKVNAKRTKFRIVANDHKTITVSDGSDLSVDGGVNDQFMVYWPDQLAGGVDGNASLTDAHYNAQGWDVNTSPFNKIEGKNMGLVKMATPGVTSTAVQKAGVAYANAKNHQYRIEVPANQVTEDQAFIYANETIGRSEYAVVAFPSYAYVTNPQNVDGNTRKLVPTTGMVHGREAAIARDNFGYHKAAAGIEAILPHILDLPTGDTMLNEEILNPAGINVIKKVKGNYIIWGDRTLWLDANWRWKHQREMMSYYEHVLQESFDWIVFAINDPITQQPAKTALMGFFLPEWRKRALRGNTFEEAAKIKIDAENNTDATRGDGDMFCDISLRLADTVERFRIRIGKQGIFEAAV